MGTEDAKKRPDADSYELKALRSSLKSGGNDQMDGQSDPEVANQKPGATPVQKLDFPEFPMGHRIWKI